MSRQEEDDFLAGLVNQDQTRIHSAKSVKEAVEIARRELGPFYDDEQEEFDYPE